MQGVAQLKPLRNVARRLVDDVLSTIGICATKLISPKFTNQIFERGQKKCEKISLSGSVMRLWPGLL